MSEILNTDATNIINDEFENDMDGKLSQFSKIQSIIYNEYIKKVAPIVDIMLDEKIPTDCGILNILMKDKNILVKIDLFNGNPIISKNIEFDNQYVWNYVVNIKFYHDPKIISIDPLTSFKLYETITFSEEFYKELNDLWNNEKYIKLRNELMNN